MKSANQLYRQYKKQGGVLDFKDWAKVFFMDIWEKANRSLETDREGEFFNLAGPIPVDSGSLQTAVSGLQNAAGYQDQLQNKYILGIKSSYVVIGSIVLMAGTGFLIYHLLKK